jgi:hypothetical protein
MDLEARKYEFIQKLFTVNESLLEQLENVLEEGIKEPQRISLEQYNQEIDNAINDVEKGDFYTQNEVEKMAKEWQKSGEIESRLE